MTISEDTRRVRETSMGWVIQRLARRLDVAMEARLGALGLTVSSFAVMMTVLESGPMTQAEIGKRFGMPAYAISRALDALEAVGYVERRAHPTSRRAHDVHATPAGLALAPQLHDTVRAVNADLVSGLEPDDSAAFLALLQRVLATTAL